MRTIFGLMLSNPVPFYPGLCSRVAGSSALPYREHHDDSTELREGRSLRKFHRAMGGKGWRRKNGWSAADIDGLQFGLNDFDGVAMGLGGHVDQIRLRDNNLSANMFLHRPEHFHLFNRWSSLSSLRFLTVLDLSKNSLRGTYFGT